MKCPLCDTVMDSNEKKVDVGIYRLKVTVWLCPKCKYTDSKVE